MRKITRTHLFALLTVVASACGGTATPIDPGTRGFPLNATLIAQGNCEGRAGHDCVGTVGLYRRADNKLVVGLQSNFRVVDVPGPRLYYSSRDTIASGPSLANNDIRLQDNDGLLYAFVGQQGFELPADAETGRNWFHIWCEPFRVEVARAQLNPLATAQ